MKRSAVSTTAFCSNTISICYTLCAQRKWQPLNVLHNKRTKLDEILHTHNLTSIWVTDTECHRNLSFCLKDFHFSK